MFDDTRFARILEKIADNLGRCASALEAQYHIAADQARRIDEMEAAQRTERELHERVYAEMQQRAKRDALLHPRSDDPAHDGPAWPDGRPADLKRRTN